MNNFKYHSTTSGFARVNYTMKVKHHTRPLRYCIQDEGRGSKHDFKLYRCTMDFEPCHELDLRFIDTIELPKGDDKLDLLVAEFIKNNNLKIKE